MALRCQGCGKLFSIGEYADEMSDELADMLSYYRVDRI